MFTGPNIVTDGLVLHLDAANTKSYTSGSTTWFDKSGNANNGTLINGPTFDSQNGGSIVFDGTNDSTQIPDNSSLNFGSGSFTIECFFRPKTTQLGGNYPAILNKGTGDFTDSPSVGTVGWILYWDTLSSLYRFRLRDGTSSNDINYSASANNDNTWRTFTITVPTSGSSIVGYHNGSSVGSVSRTVGSTNTNVALTVATWRQFSRELNTDVGIVRIYNRALTSSEVLQNYNATKSRFNL